MTYLELLNRLRELSDEQLNQDVTVYVSEEDEYYPLRKDYPLNENITKEQGWIREVDVLDPGHVYLSI